MATDELLQAILTELKAIRTALQIKPLASPGPSKGGNGAPYRAPQKSGENISQCKFCGGNVIWRESKAGKKYCVNPNGQFHSETCTER